MTQPNQWLKPWIHLSEHAHTLMSDAPEVMARRMRMMSTRPWELGTILETQGMLMEKWAAMNESLLAGWTSSLTSASRSSWRGSPLTPAYWWAPRANTQGAVRALNASLVPLTSRVRGNVKRLRKEKT